MNKPPQTLSKCWIWFSVSVVAFVGGLFTTNYTEGVEFHSGKRDVVVFVLGIPMEHYSYEGTLDKEVYQHSGSPGSIYIVYVLDFSLFVWMIWNLWRLFQATSQ